MTNKIKPPYYPIIYVRGYAMTAGEREDTFHDAYYGFATTSVEKRQGSPDNTEYLLADIFEGQFIRLMKNHGYHDAFNQGNIHSQDPARCIWICRFYDHDHLNGRIRDIPDHAQDLYNLITDYIPNQLKNECNLDLGPNDEDFKVILLAHSMGGLVCRTVIQNLMPKNGIDPKSRIHRLVTMGTPHKGIDLGVVPNSIERLFGQHMNPFNSGIFLDPARMREYLNLDHNHDLHSLGNSGFPVKRCLCIIGSDHESYSGVRHATGGFSDGLVKQDNAYIVSGTRPADGKYSVEQISYYANVHRAHSGRRGIVNSYESYENIHRFLFGNLKTSLNLHDLKIHTTLTDPEISAFYDLEYRFSIRGTLSYLHQREQNPCENAVRLTEDQVLAISQKKEGIYLHSTFLNSNLSTSSSKWSHFQFGIKVVEYHVKDRLLWDRYYDGRTIYSETLEIRLKDINEDAVADTIEYRWLSTIRNWEDSWTNPVLDEESRLIIPLLGKETVSGNLVIEAGAWPDID